MRKAWLLLAAGLAGLAALAGAFYGLLRLLRDAGGFWAEAWRVLFGVPPSLERWLMGAAVVLAAGALLLAPLSLAERRSRQAFEQRADELRHERPHDAVTPYAGVEGEGLAFDGPQGRVLLLAGDRGVGAPRVVDLGGAPPTAERPSP